MEQINLMFQTWLSMTAKHKAILKQQRWNTAKDVHAAALDYFMSCELKFLMHPTFLRTSNHETKLKSEMLWTKNKNAEIVSYIETGNSWAERLFALDFSDKDEVFFNQTLFENDALYTLDCTLVPYESYYNGFLMSKKNVKYPKGTILVEQDTFDTTPLHANSLQQFTVWVASILSRSVITADNEESYSIKFIIDNSDCLTTSIQLSHTHQSSFDVVHTSNLIDHVAALGLIVCTIPLLKDNGLLLTTSMSFQRYGYETAYNYVEGSSGLTMDSLVLLGIRCIGHEGKYNGDGALWPVPALQIIGGYHSLCPLYRMLIWRKIISSTPFVFQTLDDCSLAVETLFKCLKSAILSYMRAGSAERDICVCSHTAMNMISLFINQLSDRCPVGDFKFWDGLCNRILSEKALRPFLVHIQCQAIMMDIHMHLVVTEKSCPICNGTQLEKYFKKFSVKFSNHNTIEMYSKSRSFILTCLHPKSIDPKRLKLTSHNLHFLPQNVFLFDANCIIKLDDTQMRVDILIPADMFNVHECAVTMFLFNFLKHDVPMSYATTGNPITATVPLISDLIDVLPLVKPPPRYILQPNPSQTLGQLVSLEYIKDGQYKVQISISAKTVSALEQTKLTTQTVSDTEFSVVCDTDSFNIRFGLPVNYNRLKLKYSKKNCLIMINVPCKPFNTYSPDQCPLFYSDPANMVIHPILQLDSTLDQAASSQLMVHSDLRETLKVLQGQNCSDLPPSVKAKLIINSLFQQSCDTFQLMKGTKICGLVAVHRKCFDIQYMTAALDVLFHIDVNGIDSIVLSQWKAMNHGHYEMFSELNDDELLLLKEVFMIFHSRTRITTKGIIHPLKKFNLDEYFQRAMLYHLTTSAVYDIQLEQLQSQDHALASAQFNPNIPLLFQSVQKNLCNFCKSEVKNIMKCSKCLVAIYCGRECQVKDWKTHKQFCVKSVATPPNVLKPSESQQMPKCSYCQINSANLKKCTRCKKVMYCSKNCQMNHWSDHKLHCQVTS